MAGESKGTEAVSLGTEWGGGKWQRRYRSRAKLEEGDDRWGPPVSQERRGVKAACGKNWAVWHRLTDLLGQWREVVTQERVGRHGRSGPARPKWKESFKTDLIFLNFNGFQILARLWKFVQGDLRGILIRGFFLNSSRLLKDFRKI
jgi:hypothetical protein